MPNGQELNQQKIDAWYEKLTQQLAQPPYSFNPTIPTDVQRFFKALPQSMQDGRMMDNVLNTGASLFENRNELYRLAAAGELYIFPLGGWEDCSQIRVEPAGKLLYDLRTEVVNQPALVEPVEQKMGLFKRFLNFLFGAFEDERVTLEQQHAEAMRTFNYTRNCNAQGTMIVQNDAVHTLGLIRFRQMEENLEAGRQLIPQTMENLNNRIQNEELLPWQRDGIEAKLQLFTALNNGIKLTKEQHLDILAKTAILRLGEYADKTRYKNSKATELQRLFHEQPEKAQEYIDMIKQSAFAQKIANDADTLKTFSLCSNEAGADALIQRWKQELEKGDEQMQKFGAELRQMTETKVDTIESLERELGNNRGKQYYVERTGMQAKHSLLTAQQDGKTFTKEELQDLIGKVIVGRLGSNANDREAGENNPLREHLRKNPESAKQLTEVIKETNVVKQLAEKGDVNAVIQEIRSLKSMDQLVKNTLNEVTSAQNQKIADAQVVELVNQKEAAAMGVGGM
jgi:hypothetical protein